MEQNASPPDSAFENTQPYTTKARVGNEKDSSWDKEQNSGWNRAGGPSTRGRQPGTNGSFWNNKGNNDRWSVIF